MKTPLDEACYASLPADSLHVLAPLRASPHVRVKIGNQLYDGTATVVNDPALVATLNLAYAKKTPGPPPANGAVTYYYHFVPDAAGAKS